MGGGRWLIIAGKSGWCQKLYPKRETNGKVEGAEKCYWVRILKIRVPPSHHKKNVIYFTKTTAKTPQIFGQTAHEENNKLYTLLIGSYHNILFLR